MQHVPVDGEFAKDRGHRRLSHVGFGNTATGITGKAGVYRPVEKGGGWSNFRRDSPFSRESLAENLGLTPDVHETVYALDSW